MILALNSGNTTEQNGFKILRATMRIWTWNLGRHRTVQFRTHRNYTEWQNA
ncbi:hypothetical protein X975_06598, partial [Stegodyphus mimosarum]